MLFSPGLFSRFYWTFSLSAADRFVNLWFLMYYRDTNYGEPLKIHTTTMNVNKNSERTKLFSCFHYHCFQLKCLFSRTKNKFCMHLFLGPQSNFVYRLVITKLCSCILPALSSFVVCAWNMRQNVECVSLKYHRSARICFDYNELLLKLRVLHYIAIFYLCMVYYFDLN